MVWQGTSRQKLYRLVLISAFTLALSLPVVGSLEGNRRLGRAHCGNDLCRPPRSTDRQFRASSLLHGVDAFLA